MALSSSSYSLSSRADLALLLWVAASQEEEKLSINSSLPCGIPSGEEGAME